jgi:hypothetical protein
VGGLRERPSGGGESAAPTGCLVSLGHPTTVVTRDKPAGFEGSVKMDPTPMR